MTIYTRESRIAYKHAASTLEPYRAPHSIHFTQTIEMSLSFSYTLNNGRPRFALKPTSPLVACYTRLCVHVRACVRLCVHIRDCILGVLQRGGGMGGMSPPL